MNLPAGKNIRLFKNSFLERCTYVHPAMPVLLWGPVVLWGMTAGLSSGEMPLSNAFVIAGAGLFIWTLSEYVLHRFVFHFTPRGAFQERLSFLIHGIHHDDPEDARRLLMPPVAAIAIASVFYALFYFTMGAINTKPFFAGFIFGYLLYDYTHFAVHFARPKSKWFKALKQNHMLHHYTMPDLRYGVSNTLWDYVFGTTGAKYTAPSRGNKHANTANQTQC